MGETITTDEIEDKIIMALRKKDYSVSSEELKEGKLYEVWKEAQKELLIEIDKTMEENLKSCGVRKRVLLATDFLKLREDLEHTHKVGYTNKGDYNGWN